MKVVVGCRQRNLDKCTGSCFPSHQKPDCREAMIYIFLLSSVCGRAPLNTKIVGGGRAKAGAWPWQDSIHVIGFGHHCGGTLITKDWLLSAAHCFQRFDVLEYSA
uniref:Peptidase S1 domain-containing protein n=1 Tax=Cyprinus carpio TaxID=7962 RepID=A0A8C1RI98_CYPCA